MNIKQCTLWLILGLQLSCDTSIEPLNRERGIFSIYGALDMNDSTNYIRVKDMNVPFSDSLDATVTLTNLTNGTTVVLPSQKKEYEGIFLHNFLVEGQIPQGVNYQLDIKRSDGETVTITTTTPSYPDVAVTSNRVNCHTPITIDFTFSNPSSFNYVISYPVSSTSRERPRVLNAIANETKSITFTPISYLSTVYLNDRFATCGDFQENSVTIFYTHYDADLYPYDSSPNDPDFEDLLQSTHRFGAYYNHKITIPIDTARVR